MPQLDWDATINAIRESLPQTQFQNWFKPLTLVRCDDTSIVVGVPSKFHEEWLRNHYASQLSHAIRKTCGTDLQLEFEVLVQNENFEASLSPNAPLPMTRASLRVIEGKANESENRDISREVNHQAPTRPNLPPFGHPFFQLEFNQFAYQCANLMSQGKLPVSPLIIQAGIGMGKTHLLSEIGQSLHRGNPKLRIRYTNAENFTAEMVHHIRANTSLTFKSKFRDDTDILLFDDLHGLAGRLKIQEELLHCFNEITARGGMVAFTCLQAPQRLEEFIDPLKSRVSSGLIAEIRHPGFEDKVQLLAKMCENNRLDIDPLFLRSLADKGQKDVRELIGTLLRIHLQSELENKPLTSETLRQEGWIGETKKEVITLDEIITLVEHNFGISRDDMISKSRKSVTVWARQVAMYLARHHTLLPLEEIGKTFGRDHATVIHAFQKVTETMESQPTRRYEVEFLKQKLQNRSPQSTGNALDFPDFARD